MRRRLSSRFVVAVRNLNDLHEEEVFSTLSPYNATLKYGAALTAQGAPPELHFRYGCRADIVSADGVLDQAAGGWGARRRFV